MHKEMENSRVGILLDFSKGIFYVQFQDELIEYSVNGVRGQRLALELAT